MTVLGIDPGSVHTGYGIIAADDRTARLCGHGAINPKGSHVARLGKIYDGILAVIRHHRPDACAIEMPVYARNPQAMLKLGRAQAAAMLAAAHQDVIVQQYTPKQVKQAVTGTGSASKEQVAYMVSSLLGVSMDSLTLDESDACAVALCHWHRQQSPDTPATHAGWEAFIRANPDRMC